MACQVYTLGYFEERLKRVYSAFTEGKFTDALRTTNAVLHTIPLLVVATRKEVDEVKDLISIARSVEL